MNNPFVYEKKTDINDLKKEDLATCHAFVKLHVLYKVAKNIIIMLPKSKQIFKNYDSNNCAK